jgi:hypothetical protein
VRKRSVRQMWVSLVQRLFIVEGLFRGVTRRPPSANSYPTEAEVLR